MLLVAAAELSLRCCVLRAAAGGRIGARGGGDSGDGEVDVACEAAAEREREVDKLRLAKDLGLHSAQQLSVAFQRRLCLRAVLYREVRDGLDGEVG